MSLADHIFIDMCNDILTNGTSTEGEKVRPHWPDGTPAYTIKKFGVVNRYDLSKEFPILTLRRTALKSATDEMLWIWQRKSNNIHDLNSHVWDEWADENGSIGKAYGYQMQVKHQYKEGMMDQVDRVIYDLKNNPFSRRIMTNIYVHQDLHEMKLYPCAYGMTFNVTQKKGEDRLTLNAILNQRSQDVLAANNWNVVQYAVLRYGERAGGYPAWPDLVLLGRNPYLPYVVLRYAARLQSMKWYLTEREYREEEEWLTGELEDEYGLIPEIRLLAENADYGRVRLQGTKPCVVLDFCDSDKVYGGGLAAGSIWLDFPASEEKERRVASGCPQIRYFSVKKEWKDPRKALEYLDTISKNGYNNSVD